MTTPHDAGKPIKPAVRRQSPPAIADLTLPRRALSTRKRGKPRPPNRRSCPRTRASSFQLAYRMLLSKLIPACAGMSGLDVRIDTLQAAAPSRKTSVYFHSDVAANCPLPATPTMHPPPRSGISRAMTPVTRRNACPTIARPMATGDGLLARLPPTGPLSPAALRAICDAARAIRQRHRRDHRPRLDPGPRPVRRDRRALRGGAGRSRHRRCVAGDSRPAARRARSGRNRRRAAAGPRHSARRSPPHGSARGSRRRRRWSSTAAAASISTRIDADLRLVATDDARFHLGLGGTAATATPVGSVARERAVDAALAVLALLAEAGPAARGRDLDPAAVAAAVGAAARSHLPMPRPPAEPVGVHRLADGTCAVGIGLPFGQIEAATLAALVDAARGLRRGGLRARRGPHAAGARPPAGRRRPLPRARRRSSASSSGADDPRRAVIACAGAPACAAGLMPARAIAAERRRRRGADARRLGHPPHLGLRQGLRPPARRRR